MEAARLLGRAEALREAPDASLGPFERRLHETTLATVHEHLDAAALVEAWREGRAGADQTAAAGHALVIGLPPSDLLASLSQMRERRIRR